MEIVAKRLSSFNGIRRRARDESGSMLLELVISMLVLSVAVGALLSLYVSTNLSLRRSSIQGNALTLADKQMEVFKTLPFASIGIQANPTVTSPDPYVTSPPSNLTAGQQSSIASAQVKAGLVPSTQTVTGPDNRTYRVDTYVFSTTISGRTALQVTIGVRLVTNGTVDSKLGATANSAFDAAVAK